MYPRALFVVCCAMVIAGCTGVPGDADDDAELLSMDTMQQADSVDECVVVAKSCHGKRVAINEQYHEDFLAEHRSGPCTALGAPIDMLEYNTAYEDGQCVLNVEPPQRCQDGEETEFCSDMQSVIDENY